MKRALVTGGAHRLGGAITRALADDGYRVAIHYRSSDGPARDLARKITAAGGAEPVLLPADLAQVNSARELGARAAEALGGLDVLVNSAGTFNRVAFADVDEASWNDSLNVNLRAYFFVAQSAAPSLRESNGSIVNISDIAAFDTWQDYIPHSVAKAGVEALTRLLALELAPEVRVNAIAPGAVMVPDSWDEQQRARRAERSPLKRLGEPDDVVRAVRYLVGAPYVTGTTLVVDGGQLVRRRDHLEA